MARHAGTHRILRAFVEGRPEWLLARGSGAFLLPEGPYGADPPVGRRIGAPGELQLLAPTVPTKIIGEHVMQRLRKMDQVAYVRFASVYKEFRDVSEFVDEISSLAPQPPSDISKPKK